VSVFQVGDYLDLWRESPDPLADPDVPNRIRASHPKLVTLLEDPRLGTGFLLGNHDFELYKLTAYNTWERRFFIPDTAPGVIVMHGDYFDWVERELPAELRDIAVYLFGESHQAGSAVIGKMADLPRKYNGEKNYADRIQLAKPAALGPCRRAMRPCGQLQRADGWAVLDTACQECVKANRQFGTGCAP